MHHEKETSQEIASALFLESLARRQQLGPTGRFPGGHLTENDEGEIAFAVGTLKGKVVLNFGTPVASLGMSPAEARTLANSLFKNASKAEETPEQRKRRRRRRGRK